MPSPADQPADGDSTVRPPTPELSRFDSSQSGKGEVMATHVRSDPQTAGATVPGNGPAMATASGWSTSTSLRSSARPK